VAGFEAGAANALRLFELLIILYLFMVSIEARETFELLIMKCKYSKLK
jgi:hypothetical protein